MPEWRVRIKGHHYDLEALSSRLQGSDYQILSEDGAYYLSSSSFAALSEASDVHHAASTLVERLNGIGKLFVDGFARLELDAVTFVRDDGSHQNLVFLSGTLQARIRLTATLTVLDKEGNAKEEKPPQSSTIESSLIIANTDEPLAKVLRIFGNQEHNWVKLYNVYEIIEHDVGGEKVVAGKGWASRRQIALFRQTACNPAAVGDDARHGASTMEPPKNPMMLRDAVALIQRIGKAWLEEKTSAE